MTSSPGNTPNSGQSMFTGAANNYGNPFQQAIQPMAQQFISNPFQLMSQSQNQFQSPMPQPNYSYQAPQQTQNPTGSLPMSIQSSPTAFNQSQINQTAGLPATGAPIPQSTIPVQTVPATSAPQAQATPALPWRIPATGAGVLQYGGQITGPTSAYINNQQWTKQGDYFLPT